MAELMLNEKGYNWAPTIKNISMDYLTKHLADIRRCYKVSMSPKHIPVHVEASIWICQDFLHVFSYSDWTSPKLLKLKIASQPTTISPSPQLKWRIFPQEKVTNTNDGSRYQNVIFHQEEIMASSRSFLGWNSRAKTSTSFRNCHMIQRSAHKVFNEVHNLLPMKITVDNLAIYSATVIGPPQNCLSRLDIKSPQLTLWKIFKVTNSIMQEGENQNALSSIGKRLCPPPKVS